MLVTLSSCLIWQIISFILPPNAYGYVYASTTLRSGSAIDLQKMPILAKKKKIIFSDEAHFDLGGYVNKQNCRIWDTEKPHASKTNHCLVRILVQRHNWASIITGDVTGPKCAWWRCVDLLNSARKFYPPLNWLFKSRISTLSKLSLKFL